MFPRVSREDFGLESSWTGSETCPFKCRADMKSSERGVLQSGTL